VPVEVALLIVGDTPAGRAALEYAQKTGAQVVFFPAEGVALRPVPGGWGVDDHRARAVLLAGESALQIWRAAGGAVVENPALSRLVPVPGSLAGVEVAGAGLGVSGAAAQAKSGRFRARLLLGKLDSAP